MKSIYTHVNSAYGFKQFEFEFPFKYRLCRKHQQFHDFRGINV